MNIMLGNLTVKQIEQRSGVTFPDELVNFMENNHQPSASNIAPGKWHCFDLPFMIICGDVETARHIYSYIESMTNEFKEPLHIGIQ